MNSVRLLAFIINSSSLICFSQTEPSQVKKNCVGVELGGTGITYSIGYERNLFVKEKQHQSVKIGFSYPLVSGLEYILIPLEYNFYIGGANDKLMIGGGVIGLLGTSASPSGLNAQRDYRNLYNSSPYTATSKYNTDHFNSSFDVGYAGKLGYLHSFEKINIYAYYNCFYMRFTYKYYFQPLWFGVGASFKF